LHDDSNFQDAFARLREGVTRVYAQRPPPEATDKPLQKAPETIEDPDLFRAEIAYRLQGLLGCEPKACSDHRCRRTGRCRELEESKALLDEVRARVERERAEAQGPAEGADTA
jgi:hypothetical protein